MDFPQPRNAALSIATEMAAEGMNPRQVREVLATLDLHHTISDSELKEIVSRNGPGFLGRLNLLHFETRKVLGVLLAVSSFAVLVAVVSMGYIDSDKGGTEPALTFGRSGVRGARLIVYGSIGLLVGLWMIFRPDDGDDELI